MPHSLGMFLGGGSDINQVEPVRFFFFEKMNIMVTAVFLLLHPWEASSLRHRLPAFLYLLIPGAQAVIRPGGRVLLSSTLLGSDFWGVGCRPESILIIL